jgi:DNA-binding NtrC family response regulator
MVASVLIVDDEPNLRKVLAAQLRRHGYEVHAAEDGESAVAMLAAHPVDVVVTDLRMPGMDGLALLGHVHALLPGTPVVLITAHGTIDTAVEALKRGAFDYMTKPFDQGELRTVLEKAVASARRRRADLRTDPPEAHASADPDAVAGASDPLQPPAAPAAPDDVDLDHPALRRVAPVVRRVAPTPGTVLLSGETGTGKELVARAIHRRSARAHQPFLQVHCGAIAPDLLEAELFGEERPALDGATPRRPGRFTLAQGGTLLLDEIEAVPAHVQVRLSRVLQDGVVEHADGRAPSRVDVRVIASTEADLGRMMREGRLRDDLFYALSVLPIPLPPLRERLDDLPDLVDRFVQRFNAKFGYAIEGFDDDALEALARHPWPGNLRELEAVIERACLLAAGPRLGRGDLAGFSPDDDGSATAPQVDKELALKDYLRLHTSQLERHRIQAALDADDGNVTRAAKKLGISRRSLQSKMKEYGLRER